MPVALTDPEMPPRHGLVAAWDRFFFTPANPAPLGLIRIATGLLLLWSFGWLAADLRGYLGWEGWVDQEMFREARRETLEWSLWSGVPDRMLGPAWGLGMVVIALFTAGVASRLTAPLAWAIAVSTTQRNSIIIHGFEQILTLWLFTLAVCGSSGLAYSVDRLIAVRRRGWHPPAPSVAANVGIRLIQVTLAILYGAAGVAKLRGGSWWDGSAIMKILGNAEFRPFDMTWIVGLPGGVYLLNLAAHLALWTEVLYPVLIWKPAFRRWVLGSVVAMHAGIALTMGLTEFSLVMLAGNLAFVHLGVGRRGVAELKSVEGVADESTRPTPASRRTRR